MMKSDESQVDCSQYLPTLAPLPMVVEIFTCYICKRDVEAKSIKSHFTVNHTSIYQQIPKNIVFLDFARDSCDHKRIPK